MEKLDLSYNQLDSVGPGVFRGLSRLRQLFLNNNRLTVLQKGSLDMLPALEVLQLATTTSLRSRTMLWLRSTAWWFWIWRETTFITSINGRNHPVNGRNPQLMGETTQLMGETPQLMEKPPS
ncbi:hypothetical protein F7725_004123 [Dissostichus mawsoni]|uniref:Uncharacterized protein n=1 Tax=Dissostichus mawsoni TaxID=36200 RepID=A0A7J5YCA2_DISMA|nr:hypothetical protein F7725_004123 [Dissostichus mawsoni]